MNDAAIKARASGENLVALKVVLHKPLVIELYKALGGDKDKLDVTIALLIRAFLDGAGAIDWLDEQLCKPPRG